MSIILFVISIVGLAVQLGIQDRNWSLVEGIVAFLIIAGIACMF